ncbi:MAG: hypothetical protein ACTS45_00585 [Candidatus Hodgkinia cicadicola]
MANSSRHLSTSFRTSAAQNPSSLQTCSVQSPSRTFRKLTFRVNRLASEGRHAEVKFFQHCPAANPRTWTIALNLSRFSESKPKERKENMLISVQIPSFSFLTHNKRPLQLAVFGLVRK